MPAKKTQRRNEPNYCSYIHKVMKQVHPNLQIQQKTMFVVNSLVENIADRLTKHAANTALAAKKGTLQAPHVQAAVRLLMPDTLAKHAIPEGSKAVSKFSSA